MVEGEHDSFDTSIVPDEFLDEDIILSSGPSQLSNLSQLSGLSSQSNGDWNIGSSQDNSTIQDFITKADDERVIMRSPFQPSVPGAARRPPRTQNNGDRLPEPEFYMPKVDVDSPYRASSTGSGRTVKPMNNGNLQQRWSANPTARRQPAPKSIFANQGPPPPSIGHRLSTSLAHALYDILEWAFGVVGMTFRFAQRPLALALAIYFVFGTLILASNWLTQSFYVAISPICNIPGLNYVVDLPFCPSIPNGPDGQGGNSVDFDSLMDVQGNFEQVLEKSTNGASLPLDMRRSLSSMHDLRTMVLYSDFAIKDTLLLELDGFITVAPKSIHRLQAFNVHVGAAVDSVIGINMWTTGHLNRMIARDQEPRSWLEDMARTVFAPFLPAALSEHELMAQYIQHTEYVSEKIQELLVEADAVLQVFQVAEAHLDGIRDIVAHARSDFRKEQEGDFLLNLVSMLGYDLGRFRGINKQLKLMSTVESNRMMAVAQVTTLVHDLQGIQAQLDALRAEVRKPGAAAARGGGLPPLSAHIYTIDLGIERLRTASKRLRAVEDERIQEALMRGREAELLIEHR